MSASAMRAALNDWADEMKDKLEFSAFGRLIAKGDERRLERLAELYEFHASEEAIG